MLEIDKLDKMLREANIPFERDDEDLRPKGMHYYMYRIAYPKIEIIDGEIYKAISVIQGYGSYGNAQNLLEISQGLNEDVEGSITAEEAFTRISKDWNERNS